MCVVGMRTKRVHSKLTLIMSAQYLPDGLELHRSKGGVPFKDEPKHGDPGWALKGSEWVGYIFWNRRMYPTKWVTEEEFQLQTGNVKENNKLRFASDPERLRKIKRLRSGGEARHFSHY